jgi:predicted membrane metal-binding protein
LPLTLGRRIAGPVGSYLLFTLAVQVMTLPIIAYHLQRVSLVFILANLIILPAQPPESLDALLAARFPTVERYIEPDPFRAVELAKSMTGPEGLVCVTGSIFWLGRPDLRWLGRCEYY